MTSLWLAVVVMALTACTVSPAEKVESANASALTVASPSVSRPSAIAKSEQSALPRDCTGGALELRLTPSRAQVVLGEPAVVLVSLRNCSRQPVEVPLEIEPEYFALRLQVSRPDAERRDYVPPIRRETRRRLTVVMEPGSERATVVHIYTARDRQWFLDARGPYEFVAQLVAGAQTIVAPPTVLRVQPPPKGVAPDDLTRLGSALGPALFTGRPDAAAAAASAAGSKSLAYVRPFISVAEVLAASEQQYDGTTQTFKTPRCGDLVPRAREIVGAIPDPYFRALAAVRLGRCLASTNELAASRQLLQYARTVPGQASTHLAIDMLLREGLAKE